MFSSLFSLPPFILSGLLENWFFGESFGNSLQDHINGETLRSRSSNQNLEKSWEYRVCRRHFRKGKISPSIPILLYQQQRGFSKPHRMGEADAVDHFARIPEELLVSIFSRLENLKYMCGCSLVSKRFALAIYQIKSVSLTLPSTEISTAAIADKIDELFLKMAGFSTEEIIRFIQSSSIKDLKFFLFLQNFRELRSISLEFKCPRIVCSSSLFKMRVKFSGGGAKVEKFVSLVGDIVCKESEWEDDDELQYRRLYRKNSVTGTFLPLGCCTDWLLVICLLVKCHPSLVGITITNCKQQGTLILRDEQLVAWRNNLVPGGFLNDFMQYSCTSGWTRELFMPESGYLLKGVNFVISRLAGKPDYDSAKVNDDAIIWEYVGDDKLLPEALREFERQYNDPFITSRLAGFF